jgi:hypothetical protein
MFHLHFYHWLMNFIGVNNGENAFATHMYNFWSGFGGNISVLALSGTVFGVYRHNLKRFSVINPLHIVHKKDKN